MAVIVMSRAAIEDAGRLFDFLASHDPAAAKRAGQALATAISRLERFPAMVPALDGQIRILTVPFGRRGYSVAYVYEEDIDRVLILGIKHQAEALYPFELQSAATDREEQE